MNRVYGLNTYEVNMGWIMGFFAWCNLDLSWWEKLMLSKDGGGNVFGIWLSYR